MLKIFIVVFCAVHTSFAEVDDTPGGNLTFIVNAWKGQCPRIPGYLVAVNRTLYEGRWYVIEMAVKLSQGGKLACTIWDTYFDKEGIAHNFMTTLEFSEYGGDRNMLEKHRKTKLTPVKGISGVFKVNAGLTNNDRIYSTFYYMDCEMFFLWECKEDDTKHFRNIMIGYRSLNMVRDKREQLDRIFEKLIRDGAGNIDTLPIYHGDDCQYPPWSTNPYK